MTPDDVHSVAFRKPPIGKRGYDEVQVDALLDRIEATLRGTQQITRDELTEVDLRKPPFGKRGYCEEEVDSFIQRVIAEWPTES
jgi:DivIVA domain-containing protein